MYKRWTEPDDIAAVLRLIFTSSCGIFNEEAEIHFKLKDVEIYLLVNCRFDVASQPSLGVRR
jgi:hypothetical protein